MAGAGVVKSLAAAVVVTLVGYVGMVAAESVEAPPARVVDALVDTDEIGTQTARDLFGSATTSSPFASDRSTSTTTGTPPSPTSAPGSPAAAGLPSGSVHASPSPAATATSTTLVPTTPRPPTARERGERALAGYSYDWERGLPGWEISFHPGREGVLGYTFVQEKRIEVYVRKEMSNSLLAHVIAHELGHAIDVTHNSGDDRRRWQEQRGISDRPWWPGNGATDFATGAGDFAEAFAAWQVGTASFRSELSGAPSAEDRALLAELVSG